MVCRGSQKANPPQGQLAREPRNVHDASCDGVFLRSGGDVHDASYAPKK